MDWSRAACRKVTNLDFAIARQKAKEKKAICEKCPIKDVCLTEALSDSIDKDKTNGIRGGTTYLERMKIREETGVEKKPRGGQRKKPYPKNN